MTASSSQMYHKPSSPPPPPPPPPIPSTHITSVHTKESTSNQRVTSFADIERQVHDLIFNPPRPTISRKNHEENILSDSHQHIPPFDTYDYHPPSGSGEDNNNNANSKMMIKKPTMIVTKNISKTNITNNSNKEIFRNNSGLKFEGSNTSSSKKDIIPAAKSTSTKSPFHGGVPLNIPRNNKTSKSISAMNGNTPTKYNAGSFSSLASYPHHKMAQIPNKSDTKMMKKGSENKSKSSSSLHRNIHQQQQQQQQQQKQQQRHYHDDKTMSKEKGKDSGSSSTPSDSTSNSFGVNIKEKGSEDRLIDPYINDYQRSNYIQESACSDKNNDASYNGTNSSASIPTPTTHNYPISNNSANNSGNSNSKVHSNKILELEREVYRLRKLLSEEKKMHHEKTLEWKKEKEKAELQASSDMMCKAHAMIEQVRAEMSKCLQESHDREESTKQQAMLKEVELMEKMRAREEEVRNSASATIEKYRRLANEVQLKAAEEREASQIHTMESLKEIQNQKSNWEKEVTSRHEQVLSQSRKETEAVTEKLELERKKFALLEIEIRKQFDLHCQSYERQMRDKASRIFTSLKQEIQQLAKSVNKGSITNIDTDRNTTNSSTTAGMTQNTSYTKFTENNFISANYPQHMINNIEEKTANFRVPTNEYLQKYTSSININDKMGNNFTNPNNLVVGTGTNQNLQHLQFNYIQSNQIPGSLVSTTNTNSNYSINQPPIYGEKYENLENTAFGNKVNSHNVDPVSTTNLENSDDTGPNHTNVPSFGSIYHPPLSTAPHKSSMTIMDTGIALGAGKQDKI